MIRALKKKTFLLFLVPALIPYTLFYIYPVLSSIPYSLTKYSGIGTPKFIGFQNYKSLFENPMLKQQIVNASYNNLYLLMLAIAFLTPLAFFLAYSLYRRIPGAGFFKVSVFLPYFINFVALAMLSMLISDPNNGIFAVFRNLTGIKILPDDLFSNRLYTVPYVLLVTTWNSVGYTMLIILSNLTMVDRSLVEAAMIDGAGEWKCFWHIYFPLSRPALVNVLVLNYVWAISVFDIPYLLGGTVGGVGYKMDFFATFYYRCTFAGMFVENAMGLGTTIATLISLLAMGGALFIMRVLKRRGEDLY